MKYIGKVPNTPHAKDIYDVHITKNEMETIDLLLSLYGPFLSSNKVLLIDDTKSTVKHRIKTLRMGINQIKSEVNNDYNTKCELKKSIL